MRISSPPVKWPCFYGIDFATRAELIATGLSIDEICRSLGADSLGYVSLDGLVAATTLPAENLCRACFDGVYPIDAAGGRPPRQARAGGEATDEAQVRTDVDGLMRRRRRRRRSSPVSRP